MAENVKGGLTAWYVGLVFGGLLFAALFLMQLLAQEGRPFLADGQELTQQLIWRTPVLLGLGCLMLLFGFLLPSRKLEGSSFIMRLRPLLFAAAALSGFLLGFWDRQLALGGLGLIGVSLVCMGFARPR